MFWCVGLLSVLGLVESEVEGLFIVAGLAGSELEGLASSCAPVSWTLWLNQASLYYRMMQCVVCAYKSHVCACEYGCIIVGQYLIALVAKRPYTIQNQVEI